MKAIETKVSIIRQGEPLFNSAIILGKARNVVAIEMDMRSKYHEVVGYITGSDGECSIQVECLIQSLHKSKEHQGATHLNFDDFKGWHVFATSTGRYSIHVCLTKH